MAGMSDRQRETARANVLWSQKALRLEDEVSSGTEMKLERWVKHFAEVQRPQCKGWVSFLRQRDSSKWFLSCGVM